MIISKVRGTHQFVPIGKIKVTYLYETLRYTCMIHPNFEDHWSTVGTTDIKACLDFIKFSIDIIYSATCSETAYFIKTLMAVLNHKTHLAIISKNYSLFGTILNGLQSNPNLAVISKCSVYKMPFGSPLIVKSHLTTYYLIFNFAPIIQSHKFLQEITENTDDYGMFLLSLL